MVTEGQRDGFYDTTNLRGPFELRRLEVQSVLKVETLKVWLGGGAFLVHLGVETEIGSIGVMEVDAQPPAENRSAFKMIGLMRGVQWRSGTIGTEQLKDLPPGLWVRFHHKSGVFLLCNHGTPHSPKCRTKGSRKCKHIPMLGREMLGREQIP